MELTSTGGTTFQNHPTINFGSRINKDTVHHQSDKLGVDNHITKMLPLEVGRIENHHAIDGLHHNSTIGHLCRPPIEESIVGNIVLIDISLQMVDAVSTHIETGHSIAGRYPYMMLVIFNNGMYDFIGQSVLAGKRLIRFTWTL